MNGLPQTVNAKTRYFSLAALVAILSLAAAAQLPSEIEGKVVAVHDGDTITVLSSNMKRWKVRLSGIDAPEIGQPIGIRAKKELSVLLFRRDVKVRVRKSDDYGRYVGVVFMRNTKDKFMESIFTANLWMIRSGFAWHDKHFEWEQPSYERDVYDKSEREARSEKIGIWSQKHPVPPWTFRNRN